MQPWIWIGLGAVAVALCIAWFALPVGEWVGMTQHWVLGLGVWGVAFFAVGFDGVVARWPIWRFGVHTAFVKSTLPD